MRPTMKKLTRMARKPLVTPKEMGSTMLSWVSTISLPDPQSGDAWVRLEMEICKVKKICTLIMLTVASLYMRTWHRR
jgi:hypothetical protein